MFRQAPGILWRRRASISAAVLLGMTCLVAIREETRAQEQARGIVPLNAVLFEPQQSEGDSGIRPYRVEIPEAEVAELRRRVQATRWPDRETVKDRSQGAQLAMMQELAKYWGTQYDWRKAEAKINSFPNFMTKIDGLDIHFIQVRSKHPNALPLLITHGWPGSVLEQLKVVGPLTDPTAFGGKAEDAFDVVIPSMPGYGFSGKPTEPGWNPDHIARAWDVLMKRLGYTRYVTQGGDWGAQVAQAMGRQAPAGLAGVHTNMPATVPAEIAKALSDGTPPPPGMTDKEKTAFNALNAFFQDDVGYAVMMHTRPQTVGYGLTDSPIGLASFLLVHSGFAKWSPEGTVLPKDEVLDEISLYWLTHTETSSGRLYWENKKAFFNAVDQKTAEIKIPMAITVFPDEIYRAPETWARRAFPNLIYFHEVDKGGHFAAWEEPALFASEMRAAFKTLRSK